MDVAVLPQKNRLEEAGAREVAEDGPASGVAAEAEKVQQDLRQYVLVPGVVEELYSAQLVFEVVLGE